MFSTQRRTTKISPTTVQLAFESRHARRVADTGFTMVELVVTLLVLSILLAIAIPTFLGATRSAVGRVAQANSNTALLEAQNTFLLGNQVYPTAANLITALGKTEKNLAFQTGPSTNNVNVSLYVAPDQNGVIMAVQSNSKKDCWYTIVNAGTEPATAGTPYRTLPASVLGPGTFFGEAKLPANGVARNCQASAVLAVSSGSVAYQTGRFPSL